MVRKHSEKTAIIALLLALAACGRNQTASVAPAVATPPSPTPTPPSRIYTDDLAQAQKLAAGLHATCLNPRDCDPAVAMLAMAEETGVELCTAFLIAPDIAATNNHCVPSDLRHAGADCTQRIWLYFPESEGARVEQAGCASVIDDSNHASPGYPDYAFLKLDHALSRRPLELSNDGLPDGTDLKAIKLDPLLGRTPRGQITTARCRVVDRTALLPRSDGPDRNVVAFAGCLAMAGNSGAPLLGSDGRARAILQAFINPDRVKKMISDTEGDDPADVDLPMASMGYATNLACVLTPLDPPGGRTLPEACSTDVGASQDSGLAKPFEITPALGQEAHRRAQSQIMAWAKKDSEFAKIEWRPLEVTGASRAALGKLFRASRHALTLIPVPACIRDSRGTLTDTRAELPVFQFRAELNPELQPETELTRFDSDLPVRIELEPLGHGPKTRKYRITLSSHPGNDSAPGTTLYRQEIESCESAPSDSQ